MLTLENRYIPISSGKVLIASLQHHRFTLMEDLVEDMPIHEEVQ